MSNIINKPALFTAENVAKIEKLKDAKYVMDTEINGVHVAVFYGDKEHPVSKSRYFALYYHGFENTLMITDGSSVEDQVITGIECENGDIIFSRYRHDFVTSADGRVSIDGGRAYDKFSHQVNIEDVKLVKLVVKEGVLQIADV